MKTEHIIPCRAALTLRQWKQRCGSWLSCWSKSCFSHRWLQLRLTAGSTSVAAGCWRWPPATPALSSRGAALRALLVSWKACLLPPQRNLGESNLYLSIQAAIGGNS